MKTYRIPFAEIPQLSDRDKTYANGQEQLNAFFKYKPVLESFQQLIEDKQKDSTNREVLKEVMLRQYQGRAISAAQQQHLDLLEKETTFTITTAHQPSLFTGPLYYIYKIISCIQLAQQLCEHYPAYHFVPIFVSGSEDHDFEEINHTHLFGKRLEWQNDQHGAVGMMSTVELQPVLEELKGILGQSENAERLYAMIEEAYRPGRSYGEAANAFTNALFASRGLLVLNMNDATLKRLFIPMMREELIERPSKALIEQTVEGLENAGFKQQATPREINLFYLGDQFRERIVFENGRYQVLNQDYSFSEAELLAELEASPEKFSPNVVMRPLYQELILPNLAYIGGGGELAYWMERQSQFAHFGLNFPMLVRRNSVLWIDKGNAKKMKKLGLEVSDIFMDTDALINAYIHANSDESLEVEQEKQQLKELYDAVATKAKKIDPTLAKTVLAEQSKQLKTLEQLEGRLVRAEKQKHDTAINQIRGLKEKLFPNNGLQERHDNFMGFYLSYGEAYFELLSEELNPLVEGFVVFEDVGERD